MFLAPFVDTRVSAPIPGSGGVLEFTVDPGTRFENPYDPDQVAVDGTFTCSASSLKLPAFWDGKGFRFRFCPTKAGLWTLAASVVSPAGHQESPVRTFRVERPDGDGFVRTSPSNGRYWQLDSGKSFTAIGLNLCWPGKGGVESYDWQFAKLQSVGGNFARIWCTQEKRLETKEVGLGRYDQSSAAYYDRVFQLAAKHRIRTMLTLDDYRVLAKTDYFNAHWADSPYNAANGGPLTEPTDFFANPLCRRLYKQRLRYLVARYGAYTSLAFWELYNEQDNIPKPGVPTDWFREMTGYVASIDPYRHPITTSYSWQDKAEVWESPAVSLTQRHLYGQGDDVDFVSMIANDYHKLAQFGKPKLIGEFGITWKEPDIKLDTAKKGTPLHDALWASIMTGDAGGALTWWWDNYLEPLDLWPVFIGISRFVGPIDFAHKNFQPLPLHADGLTVLGLQDASSGETIFWLHDPASTWKNDAAGLDLKEWSGVKVSIPETRPVTAEVWDTRLGVVLSRTRETPEGKVVSLTFPTFKRDIAVRLVAR